jgi:hypothetical protein
MATIALIKGYLADRDEEKHYRHTWLCQAVILAISFVEDTCAGGCTLKIETTQGNSQPSRIGWRIFMSQLSIPGGPEEITPEWFTAVFRKNTILTSGVVAGVQTDRIGQDRGFTGVIARVQLQYSGHKEAAPSSVVVKFPTAHRNIPSAYRTAQEKDVAGARRYFERCAREVMFYQQVAPLNSLPVPRLYYGAADDTTGRVLLVLEDLHSARHGDALHGCSLYDVRSS